jgi:hypothetical protein
VEEEMSEEWQNYGAAMIASMADVLAKVDEEQHPLLLETADYWLSVGLAIALTAPADGKRLLHLIEAEEPNRDELHADAASFIKEVLR